MKVQEIVIISRYRSNFNCLLLFTLFCKNRLQIAWINCKRKVGGVAVILHFLNSFCQFETFYFNLSKCLCGIPSYGFTTPRIFIACILLEIYRMKTAVLAASIIKTYANFLTFFQEMSLMNRKEKKYFLDNPGLLQALILN